MFFARRGLVAGKPASGEEVPQKASATNVARTNNIRDTRAPCNSSGGHLGARKPGVVLQAGTGLRNSSKLTSTCYSKLKSVTGNAEAAGGGSLASHEIICSDTSEAEDGPGGPCSGPGFVASTSAGATSATPGGAQPGARRAQQQQQLHGPPPHGSNLGGAVRTAEPPSTRRRSAAGPAAALSGSAVAAARRRQKLGLQRAVAAAPAAIAAAPPPPPPPPPPTLPPLRTATLTSTSAASAARDGRSQTADANRGTVAAVLVLVVAAAAAATAAGWLMAPPYFLRGVAVPQRAEAAWHTHPGGGASGGGGGSAVHGGLPYMAGWASLLLGGGARRAPPRGSVIATAVHRGPRSDGSGGSRGALAAGSGGAGPRQWWFGGGGQGSAPGGALTAAGGLTGPPHQLSSPVPAAAAATGGGADGSSASGSPPPQPQDQEWRESAAVRVVTVVQGGGAASPYGTSWESLADHTAQRLEWTDPSYQMLVFRAEALGADAGQQRAFLQALQGGAQVVVGMHVSNPAAEAFLRDPRVTSKLPGVVLFVGGSETLARGLTQLQNGLQPLDPGSWRTALARRLPWTPDGRGLAVWDTVQLLLGRHDSDNFLFVYLVLVNQYVTTVPQVADTTKGFDLQSLVCMAKHCGSKVVGCVRDATCKSALDCLQACTFNDQVCQYRCIVSHESPLLEQFSLCILQLHNCRNLDAKPPLLPDPAPMASFRTNPLTHETAEELFFGWLDEPGQGAPRSAVLGDRPGKPYSWLVAAGKNPAYDYFPCQHQLYYRGRGRGQVWYEPVFKAITLDGREVWRRRVYRVRRGKLPGTFHLSVLDNGVTSNEYWRILDCEEDLQYCLFYYSGAASTAGLSYSGAVLGTPDGRMPGPQHTARLHAALRRAGIEPWELSYVDNSNCGGAPLGITGPVARAAGAAAA